MKKQKSNNLVVYLDFSCNNIISKCEIKVVKNNDEIIYYEKLYGLDHAFEGLAVVNISGEDSFEKIFLNDEEIDFFDLETMYDDFMKEG